MVRFWNWLAQKILTSGPVQVARFSKVSLTEFTTSFSKLYPDVPTKVITQIYDDIKLPSRSTGRSAGYDFKAPIDIDLMPGETMEVPTGVRVWMETGWWLGCLPRSGHGFKYRLQLDNTMGVIDADYYSADNEGHIKAKITNDGKHGQKLHIDKGAGFMQAIPVPHGITIDDNATAKRTGGFGSTDK